MMTLCGFQERMYVPSMDSLADGVVVSGNVVKRTVGRLACVVGVWMVYVSMAS